MKTCRMMFYSDYISNNLLLSAIENSKHLDNCYIGLYEKTWSHEEHTSIDYQLLEKIESMNNNAKVIHMSEKELNVIPSDSMQDVEIKCRNHLLNIAREEGNDYLFIQDTDEFLLKNDYMFLIEKYIPEMKSGGFNCCGIRYLTFWKNWNYIIVNENNEAYQSIENMMNSGHIFCWKNFIMDLKSNVQFSDWHIENSMKSWILYDIFLFHGSWILTDEQVLQKIKTWGHATDLSKEQWERWYDEKWLKWLPSTEELSMKETKFPVWKKAIEYKGPLPKECILL